MTHALVSLDSSDSTDNIVARYLLSVIASFMSCFCIGKTIPINRQKKQNPITETYLPAKTINKKLKAMNVVNKNSKVKSLSLVLVVHFGVIEPNASKRVITAIIVPKLKVPQDLFKRMGW